MAFIDDLGVELFTLIFVAVLTLYMTLGVYVGYRKDGEKDIYAHISPGIIPLAIVGFFIVIMGLFSEMDWPFPGGTAAYNILFGDPYVMLGVVILGFTISIQYRRKLQYVGLLALLVGIMGIWYGISGYNLGMTKEPIVLLGMYLSFGFAGILAYPVTLILDWIPGSKPNVWKGWMIFLVLFWICLVIAVITTGLTAFPAIASHLASPP